jgi:hypothetical protein
MVTGKVRQILNCPEGLAYVRSFLGLLLSKGPNLIDSPRGTLDMSGFCMFS